MEMAERFGIPVLSLVDSAGAYPGIGAEERGQAEAIARSTDFCLSLGVPNVSIITGEGMSGGAIALTTANRVLMQVTLDDAAQADELFSVLMGEDVEARRSFITRNAKDVKFLDI